MAYYMYDLDFLNCMIKCIEKKIKEHGYDDPSFIDECYKECVEKC